MSTIHFLNVLEGDCNIIQHESRRISVIDVSNASNEKDTTQEKAINASLARKQMRERTLVPSQKIDYRQKLVPDNPIDYLKRLRVQDIFRFIITHPDMDHLDGIRDLYSEFPVINTWDTNNNKTINTDSFFGGYNKEDWIFYTDLRNGMYANTSRHTYFNSNSYLYFKDDDIKILCPTPELVNRSNTSSGDYHDASYVLLFTPPKENGERWKFLFAGDSHDESWNHIMKNYREEISNVDVLFAPHHGRDSNRSYEFLKTVKPKVTLFGNASSEHLAYNSYPPIRITNNQAGYVIIDISPHKFGIYVKNIEFARSFTRKRNWPEPTYDSTFNGYGIIQFAA
jgi:competence protein ComEC